MKLSARQNLQKGFTLIELLVVIGILGILAAALIATIDPFEQLQKASDTRTQNTAVEYQTALTRYYVSHQELPWEVLEADGGCADSGISGVTDGDILSPITLASLEECTEVLIQEGELKEAFITAPGLDSITVIEPYITGGTTRADNRSTAICYIPESKAGKAEDNARYDENGTVSGSCPSDDPADGCHWCAE